MAVGFAGTSYRFSNEGVQAQAGQNEQGGYHGEPYPPRPSGMVAYIPSQPGAHEGHHYPGEDLDPFSGEAHD